MILGVMGGKTLSSSSEFRSTGFQCAWLLGLVLVCISSLEFAWSSESDIHINEILYHPASSNTGGEFVELYNSGQVAVDISGWSFTEGISYTFPQDSILTGGDYIVAVENSTAAASFYGITNVAGQYEGKLSNGGERITLVDEEGRVIESFTYGDSSPWPTSADGDGPSLERIDQRFDEDFPGSWRSGSAYSPGRQNRLLESLESNVILNEIYYHPVVGSETAEHVELFNRGSSTVNLGGWSLRGGIEFFFTAGTELAPGDYLILTKSVSDFEIAFPTATVTALGGYDGWLSDKGETIALLTPDQLLADEVSYLDRGLWPEGPDGEGSSLELRNPWLDNSWPESWAASMPGGSPGRANSAYEANPAPIAVVLKHDPPLPGPSQPVNVTVRAFDNAGISQLRLFYGIDSPVNELEMFDDGHHGDALAGDGIFGATIPPHIQWTIVQFYVSVTDDTGKVTISPSSAPAQNCLYLVDVPVEQGTLPLYRIIMTKADLATLRSRDIYSNDLLNCTFIADDQIFYTKSIRYRGFSARLAATKSYRIDFPAGDTFDNITELNLNGNNVTYQALGWDFARRFGGIFPPDTKLVQLYINDQYYPIYLQIEGVDNDYLSRNFPGDDHGNLYRGDHTADLSYLGTNPDAYHQDDPIHPTGYLKKTNMEEMDYSDIIELTRVFAQTPDSEFPSEISKLVDVEQWMRFFAFHNVLGNMEGGIYLETGDDYYLYHRPSDGRFVIMPWDLDATFQDADMVVLRQVLPRVRRLVRDPAFVRYYYASLDDAMKRAFTLRSVRKSMVDYRGILPDVSLTTVDTFTKERNAYLEGAIPQRLTYDSGETIGASTVEEEINIPASSSWYFFRGKSEPSNGNLQWTMTDYDDSGWESGRTGIGYGDGDDTTLLTDMKWNYLSIYLRKGFYVTDPSRVKQLFLRIDYDDGFIAYLNGSEIARRQMGETGTFVAYNSPSTGEYEAGTPETIDVSSFLSLLQTGNNVLAIQVHNMSLTDTDVSMMPELTSSATGIPTRYKFAFPTSAAHLCGHANAAHTVAVLVNGVTAEWEPQYAVWGGDVILEPGMNEVHLETIDENGETGETLTLPVYHYTVTTPVNTILPGANRWSADQSPYFVPDNLTVPSDSQLIIDPGTVVFFNEGVILDVSGDITASGSQTAPIHFLPWRYSPWDRIEVNSATGDARFEHCVFQDSLAGGVGNTAFIAALTVHGSHVDVDHCVFRDVAKGFQIDTGGDFTITNSLFINTTEAFHSDVCYGIIDSCTFINTIGYADSIDFDGAISPPPQIINCRFQNGDDDCIDTDHTNMLIEGNVISGYDGDDGKGISLEGESTPTLRNNVIYGCDVGVSIKHHCSPILDHDTIVDNRIGIHSYEKYGGWGHGYGTMTSSIVWGNDTDVLLDIDSSLNSSFSNFSQEMYGEGNISSDPLFVDPVNRNYNLLTGSPSLGTGEYGTDMGALGQTIPSVPTPTPTPSATPSLISTNTPTPTPTEKITTIEQWSEY